MTERLLVVGLGTGMDRSLMPIRRMGVDLIVVTDTCSARARDAAAQVVLCDDPGDADKVESALGRASVRGADGVMSLGYDNPPVISRLCRAYGCPGLDETVALDSTLKDRRLRILAQNGLPMPRHAVADDLADALAAIERIGRPVVVKPVDRSGSLGVAKIEAHADATAIVTEALGLSRCGRIIVEEFLIGTEHTVAGFCVDGHVLFSGFSDRDYRDKEAFAPYFFEGGDTLPTALGAAEVTLVEAAVRRAVLALRLDPAFFNTDVLLTRDRRVVLLEVTGRVTGARIATEVVPLATGVDPLPNLVRLALGRGLEIDELRPRRADAVVQRYLPSPAGVVEWVGDIDAAPRASGVYDLFWILEPHVGMRRPPYRSSDDVLAGVIARGENLAEAERLAAEALAHVPVRVAAA